MDGGCDWLMLVLCRVCFFYYHFLFSLRFLWGFSQHQTNVTWDLSVEGAGQTESKQGRDGFDIEGVWLFSFRPKSVEETRSVRILDPLTFKCQLSWRVCNQTQNACPL